MNYKTKWKTTKKYLFTFLKWLPLASAVGAVCGVVGVLFHHAIELAVSLRLTYRWLMLLLPLLGVIIAFLYTRSNMADHRGTNGIFEAVRSGERVPLRLAPLIFIGTVLTHLGGGSSGREGAALQMGGSIGAAFARRAKLNEQELRIMMICGMSAVFSALFQTPLTATLFCIEVINVGVFQYAALVPALGAALIAYRVAIGLGIQPMLFALPGAPAEFALGSAGRIVVLSVLCGGVSILLCEGMRRTGKLYKKYLPNPYLRAAVGGVLVLLVTALVGTLDYSGAGMDLVARAVGGERMVPWAFLLKLLLTALTLGAGFRGGEIVPTLCIGATFGSVAGVLLGLDSGFAAAIGMIAVFCGAVNSPVSSIMLGIEFFGSGSLLYFAIAAAVSYMLSGRYSLYASQKLVYSKLEPRAL